MLLVIVMLINTVRYNYYGDNDENDNDHNNNNFDGDNCNQKMTITPNMTYIRAIDISQHGDRGKAVFA